MPTLKEKTYLLLYRLAFARRYRSYLERARRDLQAFYPDRPADEAVAMDMLRETLLYGTFYDEYLFYHFESLSPALRRTYLTDAVRNRLCRRINNGKAQRLVCDKYACYAYFADLYGRKALRLGGPQGASQQQFAQFALAAGQVVIKPLCQCAGRGVELLDARPEAEWNSLYRKLVAEGGDYIVEQRIEQDPGMAAFHPQSVNTVRMNTILRRGQFALPNCFVRTGCGSNFVDNGAQGGLFASIDPATGLIFTPAANEHAQFVEVHPDTGVAFRGRQIPRWDEAVALAETAARRIPKLVYVGWDLALTPKGWVVVEANKGEFLAQQITQGRGLRPEFEQLITR